MSMTELLAPLQGPAPTGPDLSFSPEFDRIQEMRRADDPTLSQGEWVTAIKTADWPGVATACEQLLAQTTKDLRVSGWLLEAWCHQRGYAGLADGLELAHGLCDAFWPGLHPQAEDGDFELRIGALSRLLLQVVQQAPALPVLRQGDKRYALRDIQQAKLLAAALASASDPSKVPTEGKVTAEEIAKAQRGTSAQSLAAERAQVARALAALGNLQATVDGQLGADGPSFAPAREALEDAQRGLDKLLKDAGGDPAAVQAAAAGAAINNDGNSSASTPGAGAGLGAGGPPATRAQALAQLRQVAAYFRATEPHSPVAYLAERAAHWGDLPLHEWLKLVIKDGGALSQLDELLGVQRQEP